MIISNIYLHPDVRELMNNMSIPNPEEYAVNIIKSKESKVAANFTPDQILASLIGDSFDVEFNGNTNNGGNASAHKRFNPAVSGTVIANVAPDLRQEVFEQIFFKQSNYSSVNLHIKNFYELESNATEYILLPNTKLPLNKTAYKKHFRIWSENNIQAAKLHNRTTIVLPGMGLGIYAGPLSNQVANLGDIQFDILQEIAEKNSNLTFRFYGLGRNAAKIGTNSNVEGIAFNDARAMIEESDNNNVLRCVAGSIDIALGAGGGDNHQIASDTNAHDIRNSINTYNVHVRDLIQSFQINTKQESNRGKSSEKELSSTLKDTLAKYFEELKKIREDGKVNDLEDINDNNETDYITIKSSIRVLKEIDFSRFKDQGKFQDLIKAEEALLQALYKARDETDPSFISQIIEFIKDVWSWMKRSFSDNRKWANSIATDNFNTSRDL